MTRGIGLALSGGGFRATLYHLGVIRALRDAGVLGDLVDVCAVSGGSIVGAHMALNWDRYTGSDEQFAEAAGEVIRFVQFDVRNRIVRRLPLLFPLRLAAKLTGRRAPRLAPNAFLEEYYRTFLYGDRRLFELPERPALHILATNVSDGVMTVFNRDGLHVQKRNSSDLDPFQHIAGQTASVAKVVGASSAFPGFFPPVELTAADLGVRDGQFPPESFTDGGVYDNLGTRAFLWLKKCCDREYSHVLVSDAGKPFQILGNAPLGFIAQSIRASDILWDRVWQLERENFGDQNGFVFAPITRIVDPHADRHALHPVVQAEVATIRTDLDRFSDLEVNALVAHGYEVARDVQRRIAGGEAAAIAARPPWEPLPGSHSLRAATVDALEETHAAGTARSAATSAAARLAQHLRRSSNRKVWSTLLDWKDWPSAIYVAAALLLFVALPVHVYRLHRHAQMLTSVIDSIAKGDPDIRLVLDIVDRDPTADWNPIPVGAAAPSVPPDHTGIDMLALSRIIDLRPAWSRHGAVNGGRIHVRDRITIRVTDPAARGRPFVLRTSLPIDDVAFRQPPHQPPLVIRATVDAAADAGVGTPRYEFRYDLAAVPVNEPVTLELGALVRYRELSQRHLPIVLEYPVDLLTVWMLFPENHPYRSYRLLRHPLGEPAAAEPMTSRYTIDHPYGQLIGWSLINPQLHTVYECRWTADEPLESPPP